MSKITKAFPEINFGGFSKNDGTLAFYSRLNALLTDDMIVLEIGCGRGAAHAVNGYKSKLRNIKGKVRKVIGVDIDPIGECNISLDEFKLIVEKQKFDIPDNSIDLIFSDFVFEHIKDPHFLLSEVNRTLKPGGYLCVRTTNRWGYVSIISRLIPDRFHRIILNKAQSFRDEIDVFPAYYRMNTHRYFKENFGPNNWEVAIWGVNGVPTYFSMSVFLMKVMDKINNIIPNRYANSLFVFARKK
jgi:SAM-dependent methyltransferase